VNNYQVIDIELVRRIGEVSHIFLSDEELEKYAQQLKVILQAFKEIDQVETDNVKPSFHPIKLGNVLREDQVENWDWEPLSNTLNKEKDYIKGPRII
jgi:aspartyl-tRNA(Asn)/glutamyl-tRNA(Gln) amidotransferase subunit C